jgi:hypothetical protein
MAGSEIGGLIGRNSLGTASAFAVLPPAGDAMGTSAENAARFASQGLAALDDTAALETASELVQPTVAAPPPSGTIGQDDTAELIDAALADLYGNPGQRPGLSGSLDDALLTDLATGLAG